VSEVLGVDLRAQLTDDAAHGFMLSQGTKLSPLVATDLPSCGQLKQSGYSLPPEVLEKQNKTQVLGVDHSKQRIETCFAGGLGPHHV
jgi:hypothetical protein